MVKIYSQPAPLQSFKIPIARIHGWRPKVETTIVDVQEGRLSYSGHLPIVVSRLDSPRGHFFIVDGNHRVIEAAIRGDALIRAILDSNVPRIQRTGGAYECWTRDMVRHVDAARPYRKERTKGTRTS